MLTRAAANNRFQLGLFSKTVADIPDDTLFVPAAGHGHPPIWILGHLAICAELGQKLLRGTIQHPDWVRLFGPGSSDVVEPGASFTKAIFTDAIVQGYSHLQRMALDTANESLLQHEHGIALFAGSPITDVGDVVALLLTNHFGFHLSQLSSCRREAGHSHLF